MRRAFRTRTFLRWMRQAGLSDETLCRAVEEMANGLIDAHLGGNLVKKRVALPGRGKSGGTRTIVATHLGDRWFFLLGFVKNQRSNIDVHELEALQELAKLYLELDEQQLAHALNRGIFTEICHGNHEA